MKFRLNVTMLEDRTNPTDLLGGIEVPPPYPIDPTAPPAQTAPIDPLPPAPPGEPTPIIPPAPPFPGGIETRL